ncbi:MAG: phosphopentomutase [Cyanobacteria bacterium HKST-UBA04]|nr:phosphopentomutase [Cyanobacteria bacterium HKST-UBA04]
MCATNSHSAPHPRRVFIIVIDALGVGAMPDAPDYGDAPGANTLGNIDRDRNQLKLPQLKAMGLGHITPLRHVEAVSQPTGWFGKMAERSIGKDTTTGHWEMMGTILDVPFPTYPDGFPPEVIEAFVAQTGCQGVLGNKPASGTAVIDEYGQAHLDTGYPIVYTSADSVFQIACHVEVVPLETLYAWCQTARQLLDGEHRVSRVIARPFEGPPGSFSRIGSARHDYAVEPPETMMLNTLKAQGAVVLGVGKIKDIFCGAGITHAIKTKNNTDGLATTLALVKGETDLASTAVDGSPIDAFDTTRQLIFVNLVDTDMNYGHRRDVEGYGHALEEIDATLAELLPHLRPDDLLMITADHGCDPTAPGSDHTREYVPLLVYSPSLPGGINLGIRQTFADIGATTLDWLGTDTKPVAGQTFLPLQPACP